MTLSSLLKPSTKPMTLRATGAGVNTIDLLPPSKTGCLSLYISYNSISSLENISQFKNLLLEQKYCGLNPGNRLDLSMGYAHIYIGNGTTH